MKRKEKQDLLVHYTTRLAVKVQGCSNHGCDFNDNKVGTNMICRCGKEAQALMVLIDNVMNTKTT